MRFAKTFMQPHVQFVLGIGCNLACVLLTITNGHFSNVLPLIFTNLFVQLLPELEAALRSSSDFHRVSWNLFFSIRHVYFSFINLEDQRLQIRMCVKTGQIWDRSILKIDRGLYHLEKSIGINLIPVTVSQ
jgi:hypothetical protein